MSYNKDLNKYIKTQFHLFDYCERIVGIIDKKYMVPELYIYLKENNISYEFIDSIGESLYYDVEYGFEKLMIKKMINSWVWNKKMSIPSDAFEGLYDYAKGSDCYLTPKFIKHLDSGKSFLEVFNLLKEEDVKYISSMYTRCDSLTKWIDMLQYKGRGLKFDDEFLSWKQYVECEKSKVYRCHFRYNFDPTNNEKLTRVLLNYFENIR